MSKIHLNAIMAIAWSLIVLTSVGSAQEDRDAPVDRERLRKHVNQLEEKMQKYLGEQRKVDAALKEVNREQHPEKHAELLAHKKELASAVASIKRQFSEIRTSTREREQESNRANADMRRRANQLEEKLKGYLKRIEEVDAWLKSDEGQQESEKRMELLAARKEMNAVVEKIRAEFASMRRRQQEGRREGERERRRMTDQEQNHQRLENLHREYSAQLKEINAWLERNRGDDYAEKRKELLKKRSELQAAIKEIQAHFSAIKDRDRAKNQEREREGEHPEIRAARNQLRHLRAAHGHLREGGFGEMATMVGQRIERIQGAISRYERGREGGERERADRDRPREGESDRPRDRDRPREREGQSDRAPERERAENGSNREIMNAIRELNAAVRSLRREVEELKKRR